MALAVLSGMDVMRFKAAVVDSDTASIAKISGLGKKTAERIVLELKDKLGVAAAWEAASADKAPSAEARAANDAVLAEVPLLALEAVDEAGVLGRAWDSIRLWIK